MQNKRYMTDQDEMFELLCSISNANISAVRRKLSKGDQISISKACKDFILIDDPYIFKKLPGFATDNLPLETIYRIFRHGRSKEEKLFDTESKKGCFEGDISFNYRILPFSKMVENKAGSCLERAILFQLSQQENIESFLVCGLCEMFGIYANHAFNIILKDEKLFLTDANPIVNKNKEYIPYIIPIHGIDLYDGNIILQPHIADTRKYSLWCMDSIREYFVSYEK